MCACVWCVWLSNPQNARCNDKNNSVYLCKHLYLYRYTVRLIWVSPPSDTRKLLFRDQGRKRLNYLIQNPSTRNKTDLHCVGVRLVALHEDESGNCSTFHLRTCTVCISLHIKVFLGSIIIQNAADCLAEHSDGLPQFLHACVWMVFSNKSQSLSLWSFPNHDATLCRSLHGAEFFLRN